MPPPGIAAEWRRLDIAHCCWKTTSLDTGGLSRRRRVRGEIQEDPRGNPGDGQQKRLLQPRRGWRSYTGFLSRVSRLAMPHHGGGGHLEYKEREPLGVRHVQEIKVGVNAHGWKSGFPGRGARGGQRGPRTDSRLRRASTGEGTDGYERAAIRGQQ